MYTEGKEILCGCVIYLDLLSSPLSPSSCYLMVFLALPDVFQLVSVLVILCRDVRVPIMDLDQMQIVILETAGEILCVRNRKPSIQISTAIRRAC